MPERPIRCRRKDKDEPRKKKWGKESKNGVKISCSKCHQVGHNKRSCKSVATQQPSQSIRQFSQPTQLPLQSTQQSSQPSMNQPDTQHSSFLCPETSRVIGNKRQQPNSSSTAKATTSSVGRKRTRNVKFGVYTNTQSGRQVVNPERPSERVISSGSQAALKNAS
ncbi:uncharacterized protein LOC129873061 isoform X2 [Solanum dulcamara]|uniref:uncharacterized protein LOC129873061 isoform X2 n=1 Tax=Solanum dulcamara TaxID=45834 RepID=UPI00248678C8|nr:uncharacterized protein LOC129873061 isoform X2 [Solanum dulcamara]